MILKYGDERFRGSILFTLYNDIGMDEFLSYFGIIKNSHMQTVIERLYNYLFLGKINLYEEYKNYYFQEYKSFREYLEVNKYLEEDIIEILLQDHSQNKLVYLNEFSNKGDYGIAEFIKNEKIFEKIISFLEDK